jgi:hypothetical protein
METLTLPRALLDQAEGFFAAPLADVEVAVDPEVAALGAVAVAHGRRVLLAPAAADLARAENLAVLAHELAHVVQQAEGRAPATGTVGGLAANDDPALEAEADRLARRFVAGGAARRPAAAPGRPGPAVVQRLVTVGGAFLPGPGALGPEARLVLALVEGGERWLEWAAAAPATLYEFADGAALVEGVQLGLHGDPLLLLPRLALLVSPKKLMTLREGELAKIVAWEGGGGIPSLEKTVSGILHRNDLWTQGDLAAGVGFLTDVGVASKPVFQVLSLLDQLALLAMLNEPESPFSQESELAAEAAEFAVPLSRTPQEFVDYVQFYLSTVVKLGNKGTSKERRLARAGAVLEEILPYLQGLLRCPELPAPPPLSELPAILREWLGLGNEVGFDRLSAAASQVYQQSALRQQSGEEAARIIARYMADTRRVLMAAAPEAVHLLQDGATRIYRLAAPGGHATLVLEAGGDLVLERCRLRPPEEGD